MANLAAPKMTYYARILNNLTGEHITEWATYETSIWYYGKCNSTFGGESEYIVEFDIWNNEPAFNAGMYDEHNADAKNCRFGVIPNNQDKSMDLFKIGSPFLYGRCVTSNKENKFEPIINGRELKNITGNINPELYGIVQGKSDHTIIQTKINIDKNDVLTSDTRYSFNMVFTYDYE